MKWSLTILSCLATVIILSGIIGCSNNAKYLDTFDNLNYQFKLDDSEIQSKITELLSGANEGYLKHSEDIAKPYRDRMLLINKSIASLRNFIDSLQSELVNAGGGYDSSCISLRHRDNTAISYELMIQSGKAKGMKKRLDSTIAGIIDSTLPDRERGQIKKELFDVKFKDDLRNTPDWADKKFGKDLPLSIAVMNLTRLKLDLSCIAKMLIKSLIDEANSGCVFYFDPQTAIAFSKYRDIYVGMQYESYIFLFSDNDNPLSGTAARMEGAEVDGHPIPVSRGIGRYSVTATTPGLKVYHGKMKVKNCDSTERELQFKGEYMVSKMFVSLDFENAHFIYAGTDNPLTVTVPLLDQYRINLRLSRGEISGSNGKFSIRVNDPGPLTIYVEDKRNKGMIKVIDSFMYSVKP